MPLLQWAAERKEKKKKTKKKEVISCNPQMFPPQNLCEGGASRETSWVQYPCPVGCYSESTRGDSIKCRTLTIVIVVKSVWPVDFDDWPLVGFQMLFFLFFSFLQRIG